MKKDTYMDNLSGTPPTAGGTATKESQAGTQSSLHDKAHEAKERITAKARETKDRVQHQGEDMLREQKNRVADQISHYGSAVHRAAHNLEEEQDATIAYYTHKAADQLDHAAQYLREHDWQQLRRDAEDVARRHQDLFFSGMLLGGFALARLLKASTHDEFHRESTETSTYAEASMPYGQASMPYGQSTAESNAPAYTSTPASQPSSNL
jgi:hypothetical protein